MVMSTNTHELRCWFSIAQAPLRTWRLPRRQLADTEFGIERAYQILPRQVVHDERDRRGERKYVQSERGDGEVQKAGCRSAQRREQERQQRSVQPEREMQAVA